MKNINWWAISVLAAVLCGGVIWYAVSQGKDIGDYSTLVQAVFAIILVFATVASITRADTQIDKSQQQIDQVIRSEINHTLITDLEQDNSVSLSNLSKYSMLIRWVSMTGGNSIKLHLLVNNAVLQAGSQLKINASSFFSADLLREINEYADYQMGNPANLLAEPQFPLENTELTVAYSYGGTGSRTYHKQYEIQFDVNTDYRRTTGQIWMIWLVLKDFYYEHPAIHGSGKVDVPLADEWNIPQPPDAEEGERARRRFMRRQRLLSLIPWRRQPEN